MFAPSMTEQERATEQLQSELAEACGALNAASARVVGLLGRALATEAWAQYGIHSPSHWAAWQCGLSPSRARQWMAMARRLPTLPTTEAAFAAGAVSVDQVGAIVRHCPDHAEADVAEFAKAATVPQLSRTLRHYTWVDEDDRPVERPEAAKPEPRDVDFGSDEDGNWRLRARLPADEGALVEKALGLARDRAFADPGEGERVTWADALVGMAESSIASSRLRPERFRHSVLWHLDERSVQPHLGPATPDWLGWLRTCDAEDAGSQVDRPPGERGPRPADGARSHPGAGRAPRRGLPGAGLRSPPLAPGPPRPALARWRHHRHRQPGVPVPPTTGCTTGEGLASAATPTRPTVSASPTTTADPSLPADDHARRRAHRHRPSPTSTRWVSGSTAGGSGSPRHRRRPTEPGERAQPASRCQRR